MPDAFSWSNFEAALFQEFDTAINAFAREHPREPIFALALYHIYRELDGILSLPQLGLAGSEAPADPDGDFLSERWNPHGWDHFEIELPLERTVALEESLTAEANRGSQAHWRRTETRYFNSLVRITRRLRDAAAASLQISPLFIAYVYDTDGGHALARKTIAKARFHKLFPQTIAMDAKRTEAAELAPGQRAKFLVTRLGKFDGAVGSEEAQAGLLELGALAVPVLVPLVDDKENGWLAAKLLGTIGVASPEVIEALERHAPGGGWHATALGMLGHVPNGGSVQTRVDAATAPLKAVSSTANRIALDYRPVEALLASGSTEATRRIEGTLKPGSSYAEICATDVDEALRGLSSEHAVIRWHAASVLGDRSLGVRAGKRIQPALTEATKDRHEFVRRLASLALERWDRAAR